MKINEIKKEIIGTVGESSMCWEEIPAGVFMDKEAVEIANRLNKKVNKHIIYAEKRAFRYALKISVGATDSYIEMLWKQYKEQLKRDVCNNK